MREITGPDPLYAIDVEMEASSFNEVIRVLDTSFPESVTLENVTDTNVTVFSRERCLVTEVEQLHREGKINKYTVR